MSISLEGAIRTCKVDTAWAPRVESDRFFNPNNMVCPVWNGMDTTGRIVCPDSFWTKRAGCNSALDRVDVENAQRPQYAEYINLDASGINAPFYNNMMPYVEVSNTQKELDDMNKVTGNFGLQFSSSVYPGCAVYPYQQAMSQQAEVGRMQQQLQEGFIANRYRRASGFNSQ